MLENVPGLVNDKRMVEVESTLIAMGYDLDYKVLDAADYGVPQRRRRFILVGSRISRVHLAQPLKQKKNCAGCHCVFTESEGCRTERPASFHENRIHEGCA